MYFLLAPTILDEVAIVVHLVYLTRIQFDYNLVPKTYRDENQVVPSIYPTWYYTTLLGQHRRERQLFRD